MGLQVSGTGGPVGNESVDDESVDQRPTGPSHPHRPQHSSRAARGRASPGRAEPPVHTDEVPAQERSPLCGERSGWILFHTRRQKRAVQTRNAPGRRPTAPPGGAFLVAVRNLYFFIRNICWTKSLFLTGSKSSAGKEGEGIRQRVKTKALLRKTRPRRVASRVEIPRWIIPTEEVSRILQIQRTHSPRS